jgi:hypothetical protein
MSHTKTLRAKAGTTPAKVRARILAAWETATDIQIESGAQWYLKTQQTADDMAAAYGHTSETVAAVIAHLSPRTPWSRNIAGAAAVLSGHTMPGLLSMNLRNAQRAMASDDPIGTLNGSKVRSFAANILGDHDVVTVDVWAARVALGTEVDYARILARSGVYDAIAECYRQVARQVGVSAATMQATTWLVIKAITR